MRKLFLTTVAAAAAFSVAAGKGDPVTLSISTSAFKDGATIPKKHTADGLDVSPALTWQGAPPGTQAFALIMDDPDAPGGTWVHWVLYDLPPPTTSLPEGIGKSAKLVAGAKEGKTSWGNTPRRPMPVSTFRCTRAFLP